MFHIWHCFWNVPPPRLYIVTFPLFLVFGAYLWSVFRALSHFLFLMKSNFLFNHSIVPTPFFLFCATFTLKSGEPKICHSHPHCVTGVLPAAVGSPVPPWLRAAFKLRPSLLASSWATLACLSGLTLDLPLLCGLRDDHWKLVEPVTTPGSPLSFLLACSGTAHSTLSLP